MKIGILGGSFNPIHNNHIKIIKILLKKNLADEIWLVPCKKHAFGKELASVKDRLAMIKLAIKGIKKSRICCIELKCQEPCAKAQGVLGFLSISKIKRFSTTIRNFVSEAVKNAFAKAFLKSKGKNYTIDTIRKLKARHKKYKFFIVIGSDILHEIDKWHNYRQLLRETGFIVLKRERYKIKKVKGMRMKAIISRGGSKISSTKIRERIKDGKSIKSLVPKSVEKFIKEKGLYEQ